MKKNLLLLGALATLLLSSCSDNKGTESVDATQHETAVEETHTPEKTKEESVETEVETIKLEQTHGAFSTESLELEAGKEYNFEITNNAGRPAAFVLVKAEDSEAAKTDFKSVIIGDAALAGLLEDGQTGTSTGTVNLEAGEYVYFCPVNETPQYKITVK